MDPPSLLSTCLLLPSTTARQNQDITKQTKHGMKYSKTQSRRNQAGQDRNENRTYNMSLYPQTEQERNKSGKSGDLQPSAPRMHSAIFRIFAKALLACSPSIQPNYQLYHSSFFCRTLSLSFFTRPIEVYNAYRPLIHSTINVGLHSCIARAFNQRTLTKVIISSAQNSH
jgi:hypothetical protein